MTSDPRSDETAQLPGSAAAPAALAVSANSAANATPHRPEAAATNRAAPTTTGDLAPPEIAGYRLLERLGEGGMGVVYKAEHLALRRLVAIKMIRSGALASNDELVRFQIEGEAVGVPSAASITSCRVSRPPGETHAALQFVPMPVE